MIKCSHEAVKNDISCCEQALVVDIGNIGCNAAAGTCQHQCPCAPKAKELAATVPAVAAANSASRAIALCNHVLDMVDKGRHLLQGESILNDIANEWRSATAGE